ncbi:MAG: rod shape-determining protein MreC [Clostridium sp.]
MKFFKNKLAVTIVLLSVTFLGLIIYSVKSEDKTFVEDGAGAVLNPVQEIAYTINNKVKGAVDFFLNFSEVKEENKRLTKENNELENKLTQYSSLEEENNRLREMLDFSKQRDAYNYIATNIIGIAGNNIVDGYIIDKGTDQGIKKDMVVISSSGLVGQVTSTGNNWSIIQSVLSQNVAVSVMLESTRESTGILKGYVGGSDDNLAIVTNLPMNSEVKEGDVILTSGHGFIYPKEIRVGEVVSVEEDKVKVMKTAIVKPYVDFNKLEELFIVAPKDTREIKYEN